MSLINIGGPLERSLCSHFRDIAL